jgi:hypothetical protein
MNEVDSQPDLGDPGEPSFEVDPHEAESTNAPRWSAIFTLCRCTKIRRLSGHAGNLETRKEQSDIGSVP